VTVDVEQERWVEMSNVKTRLFERFSHRGVLGRFAVVDVAARLHPDSQYSVLVKNDTARRNDEGGSRDVMEVGVFAVGIRESTKTSFRFLQRRRLTVVDRFECRELRF
jgi:hypothetical protein